MVKNSSTIISGFTSVHQLLLHNSLKYSQKDAIITFDPDTCEIQKISYKKLFELVYKTAGFLSKNGIGKNDRFAIIMHNSAEILIFELAGAIIGATTVPLDYKRDTKERKIFKLQETKAKALFIRIDKSQNQQEITDIKKEISSLKIFSWERFEEYLKLISNPFTSGESWLTSPFQPATPGVSFSHAISDFESTYVILYTSGTTAHPKGAILTQRACLLNAEGIAKWQEFTDSDVFNIVLPLHHINSTIFCLSMILTGGTIVLSSRYSASKFWEVVNKFKVTDTSVVPTILHDLLGKFEEFKGKNLDISSLKRICIGSAPVLPEETLRFYKTFGVRVVQGYGQTETALRVAGVPIDVNDENYIEMVKNNTIGFPLSNNELAIMDENNKRKKENEEGEICIRGSILANGYLNDEQSTKHAFKKGWFHSGDLGKYKIMNGKKFYFIIGRIREIIIKGGVNLSPSAIEDALLKTFPEIDELAVVGYEDVRMGEEITAVIVPKKNLTEKEVSKLKENILSGNQNKLLQNISKYELPKKVYVLKELPKTSTGKIQRVIVKKLIAEMISKEVIKRYYLGKINSNDTQVLESSVNINNSRFTGLPATLSEFRQRAKNGFLFGVFDEKEGLIGTISCLRIDHNLLDTVKTWNQATMNGTLANYDKNGDTMLCVAITMKSRNQIVPQYSSNEMRSFKIVLGLKPRTINLLAKKYIRYYVNSGKDHVINFHMKPKGGLPGAKVWKILENGRIEDKESMGYNVLMKYPDVNKKIIKSKDTTPSIMLIEEVLSFAQKKGIKNVIAFSRPAGFREYLSTKISE